MFRKKKIQEKEMKLLVLMPYDVFVVHLIIGLSSYIIKYRQGA